MIVYISGPMRGYRNYNRTAFFAAEQSLRKRFPFITGFINPASLDGDTEGWTHADYMRRDIALLADADAIYMLPGWVHSKGATTERQVAEDIGLLILEDPDRAIWRSFEDEPADEEEAASQEIQLFPGMDTSDEVGNSAPDFEDAEDLSAETPETEGRPEAGAEDLSEHPRWKHIAGLDPADDNGQIFVAEVGTPPPGMVIAESEFDDGNGAWFDLLPREVKPVFEDINIVTDDSLPENVLRLDFGASHIDFHVTWEHGEMRLTREPDLEEISTPQPADEFPNVGYVRRFMTLMGLPAPGSYLDYGNRRSA